MTAYSHQSVVNCSKDPDLKPRVLVVDDNEDVRDLLRLHLVAGGFDVQLAASGQQALDIIAEAAPELLLTDLNMPGMDGFQLIEAVRANEANRNMPIILLTAHNDVAVFRRGMDLGADDFLTKPVNSKDLLNALNSRLKRLEGMRVDRSDAGRRTTENFHISSVMGAQGTTVSGRLPVPTLMLRSAFGSDDDFSEASVGSDAVRKTVEGTVMFADIRGFSTIAERLTSDEVAELLNAFFGKACEPILDQGGWVVKFVGDGVIAMFDDTMGNSTPHAARALKAAILMIVISQRFQQWLEKRFPVRGLAPFCIGIGVHSGPVSVCQIGSGTKQEVTVIGDTVNIAARLEAKTKEFGWSIVSSVDTWRGAGERFQSGPQGQIAVKGRASLMDVIEIRGLAPRPGSDDGDLRSYETVSHAIEKNSALIDMRSTRRTENNDGSQLMTITSPIQLDGFRLIRKLSEGGMSTVYLAEFGGDGTQQVLKLISMDQDDDGEAVQRFIVEFALISQIQHPNVAKIYQQGFSRDHAYISMEYFPSGDLRKLINDGVSADVAVAVLTQVAAGLAAIHEVGIVHRDMKPDNVMIRADGSMALADFGIATHAETQLNKTEAGVVFGTPSYIAPEQAQGLKADCRADIYSLGVMFYEMLTGQKPFRATNPQALIFQHINMAIPQLPGELARFNPVLQRMMAKSRTRRHSSGLEVIEDVMSIAETVAH